jgi:YkoY family integral membrane protein
VFGQTFDPQDLGVIGLLILLEGVLSIDNALVLALLAKRLPKGQQAKALTYGLVGAFVFRFVAIGAAAYLLRWRIVKLLGGGYLAWVALQHFISLRREKSEERVALGPDHNPILIDQATGRGLSPEQEQEALNVRGAAPILSQPQPGFWATVAVIEMTDIAFAVDSILAAIAVVGSAPPGHTGPHPKLWVVLTGGMLGLVLMRIAATLFIRLLERFPRFETSAYLLVAVIGAKLLIDWGFNTPDEPHRVDFHQPGSAAFWVFWLTMIACIAFGFLSRRKVAGAPPAV